MSNSVRPHRQQPTRLPCPWDSPGKNTGVSCLFLLQCMKVKSESEVAQSCLTLSDPMDYTAHQAPPSMGFSRQEYWSGVPLPSPYMILSDCKQGPVNSAMVQAFLGRTQTISNKSQDTGHTTCTQKLPLDVPMEEILQKPESDKLHLKNSG